MKTYHPTPKDIKREWHLINAKGNVLGRLASEISRLLLGKHKALYSNHQDVGDYVVVINAKDVEVTGKKGSKKVYYRHSGYRGGLKEIKFSKLISEAPERIIEHAISGMLPDNRLKNKRMRRLKVFADDRHPYIDKFEAS